MRRPPTPPQLDDLLASPTPQVLIGLSDHATQEVIREAQAKQRHWDKVSRIARSKGLDPRAVWLGVKIGRWAQRRTLPFRSVRGEPLWFTLPPAAQRELMLCDQALAGRIGFAADADLSDTTRNQIIVSALMDEAIASSQIEGAATTREVAKEMLRQGRRPRGQSERMIANNYAAINWLRERRTEPLSTDLLLEVHRILCDGTLDDPGQLGRWRRGDENIRVVDRFGEALHEPPPAQELPARMAALCRFANDDSISDGDDFIHPVVRAILLHFQLAYDHPFCDGNGRTARALFFWSMLRAGYWLVEFLPISAHIRKSTASYGRAFLHTETDEFDATYFIVMHLRFMRIARNAMEEHIEDRRRRLASARRRFSEDTALNARQLDLLTRAVRDPDVMFTIESHQRSHGISYHTARADLLKLAEAGYLVQRKVGKQFEFYPAPSLFETH